ncbi:MAG TPA: hypothetical protein VGL39_02545 [Jatrophihabitantaceae bacterium]|jgi:hypothetical protein
MTRIRVVRYTTSAQARDENARLVSEVYSALAVTQPDEFRYATLLLDDDATFIHLAVQDGLDAPLPQLPAFQEFQRDLGSRVLAPPDGQSATVVGSYRLL